MRIRFPRIGRSLVTTGLLGALTLAGGLIAEEARTERSVGIQWTTLNQTNNLYPGAHYFLRAKLNSVINPGPNSDRPCWLQLADETGTRQIRVDRQTWNGMVFHDDIQPGILIEVFVECQESNDRIDMVVAKPWNIRLLDGEPKASEAPSKPAPQFVEPPVATPTVTPTPAL